MSDILKLRVVGLGMLAAFPLFGGGQSLLKSDLHLLGLVLCLSNSIAVFLIGYWMRSLIVKTSPRIGNLYFGTRIFESILLGMSAIFAHGLVFGLAFSSQGFYQLAMIALGIGSLPMCGWLIRSKVVSAKLGFAGLIGYACLVMAMVASSFGFETLTMPLLLPGALFEFIFGLTLLFSSHEKRLSILSAGRPL